MGNPFSPLTLVNAFQAIPDLDHIEFRSTIQFLNASDRLAFLNYLGITGGVPMSVPTKYRFKADGSFQLWNTTQSAFQTVSLTGAAGAEIPQIGAADEDTSLPNGAIAPMVTGKYRFKTDGTFELWNADQGAWQSLSIIGTAGAEIPQIGAADNS